MKSLTAAVTLAVAVSAKSKESKFMEYISKFNKSFPNIEQYMYRMTLFSQFDAQIEAFNRKHSNVKLAHNKYSANTKEEWAKMMGYIHTEQEDVNYAPVSNGAFYEIDWNEIGGVTPVKDQGDCGSCWTFASSGSLEGAHFVKSGELLNFAEQQFVDCAKFIAFGCDGGNEATAYNWAKSHYLMTSDIYPYTATNGDC